MKTIFEEATWVWNQKHQKVCRLIDDQLLWSEQIYQVWLPDQDVIVPIRADELKQLNDKYARVGPHQMCYITAVARVADALTHHLLLAPIESSVIPLLHQIQALSRAISNNRVRYLLADEVGLGKTIEAGMNNANTF